MNEHQKVKKKHAWSTRHYVATGTWKTTSNLEIIHWLTRYCKSGQTGAIEGKLLTMGGNSHIVLN